MKMIYFVLISVITLMTQLSNSQSVGDYRSVTTGNYISLTSWQRFNGTAWVTPSSAQGWPGQFTGTGNITIQSGHTISVSNTGISTQLMGLFTVQSNGQLYLTGTNNGQNFGINTPELNIISGGSVYFFNKSNLILPLNAVLSVTTGGLTGDGCNANKSIIIGNTTFAQCQGGPGSVYTFNDLMAAGGTINAIPSSNSPLCPGSTISLTGSYSGAIGSAPIYSWSVSFPNGGTTVYNTQNVSINNAISGTYSATLTVSTVLGGQTYTNSETISVIVNPSPTLSGASQPITICSGSPAIIQLSGLVPNSTFQLTYNIAGGSPVTVSGIAANSSGNASFETVNLNASNNGNTLQITQIIITNPTTNCTATFSTNVTLSVWTTGGGTWTGRINSNWHEPGNWCSGVPAATTNVYIPALSASVPNQPVISADDAVCLYLEIQTGATLTVSGNRTLDVKGNWNNSGTFVSGTGTVSLTGSTVQTVSGNNTFNNLMVNNAAGVVAGSDITVNGILNLASANPDATKGCIEMTKNYGDYSNILTPVDSLTTRGTRSWDILDSWILYMGANASTIGQGDVTGKVKRTSIAENIEYSFGSQYNSISFNKNTTGTLPTAVMFIITKGPDRGIHANKTNTVERLYQIIRTGGSLPTTFSVKLAYHDSELNGNKEDSLVLWDHHIPYSTTNTPHEHGKSSQDRSQNWVSLIGHGVNYLGDSEAVGGFCKYWMITNSLIVGNQWLGAVANYRTDWMQASNWSAGHVPTCDDIVIIPPLSLVPFSPVLPSNASAKSISIQPGGVLDGGTGSITLCGGIAINGGSGSWNNNGTFNADNSTVIFNFTRTTNEETATISGNTTFNNLVINDGTYLVVQNDAQVNIAGGITKTGFLDAASYANTFEYSGSNAQTVVNPEYGNPGYYNLKFSGAGTKTLPAETISIKGNLTFDAVVTSTGNTLVLNGYSQQIVAGTVEPLLNKLTINNEHGATLSTGVGIDTELTLTNGIITTGSNTLTMECSGTIAGGSTGSHINGKLAQRYCSTGSKTFPIGKAGNYRPLTLNYTALTGTSSVIAEQFESTIQGTLPANIYVQEGRYWQISQTGRSAYSFDLTLDGTAFEVENADARIVSRDGVTNTAHTASPDSYQFTTTSLSSFGNFAVANECTAPVITSQPAATSVCMGADAQFEVTTSTTGVTYQWQVKINSETEFINLNNSETVSGANTSSLTIHLVQTVQNGYKYRVIINRSCGNSSISNEVMLTVNALPTITLVSRNITACTGNATAQLAYSDTSENPTHYRIIYNQEALDAGFSHVAKTILPDSPVNLPLPTGVTGSYSGYIIVSNSHECESEPVAFTLVINVLPQGSFGGNTTCAGNYGLLTWTATAGSGPFSVVYNDGLGDRTVNDVISGVAFSTFSTVSSTSQFSLISVTGSYGCSRTTDFTQVTATVTVSSGIWNGSVSTDWHEPANWCGGVPEAATDVLIPANATRMPVISAVAFTHDLNIETGASVVISGDRLLTVNGNLTVHGELDLGTGQLALGSESDIDNTGTIYTKRQTTNALPEDKNWGDGIVMFNAATGTQQLVAGTFGDLILSNPEGEINIKASADVLVNYRLSVNSGQLIIDTGRKIKATNVKNYAGTTGIQITGSSETQPNGTFIFLNNYNEPVEGSVQMYSKATASTYNEETGRYSNYKWQYFGIPLRSVVANPTFNGSFLRGYNETILKPTSQWVTQNNSSVLQSFKPYQITQPTARLVNFAGILENKDTVIQLTYTSGSNYPGQHLIGNPYTAAIDITKINFGDATESTIYLYNTGSYQDWLNSSGYGENPGQYTAIPKNLAEPTIPGDLPREIPSMQAFLVKKLVQDASNIGNFNIGISYESMVTKSTKPQRAKSSDYSNLACMVVQASDNRYFDKLWIYDVPGCSRDFDNGWDGQKMGGPANVPLIYAEETSGIYQVNSIDDFDGSWLTFRSGESSEYSLSFSYFNISKYANRKIMLTDTQTNEVIDVTEDGFEYSFTATPYTMQTKRFLISTIDTQNVPANSIWTGAISQNWNHSGNWSNGIPGSVTNAIIPDLGNYPTLNNVVSCANLTLQPNSKLTINQKAALNVTGNVLIESNAVGTATLINHGSLTVSGTTTMQQYFASKRNWYTSSPFGNATAPEGYTFHEYREPGDNVDFVSPATEYWKNIAPGATFTTGTGFIANPATGPAIFSLNGTLNTGDIELNLTRTAGKDKEGFNLVGNPYPSYLCISSIMTNRAIDKSFWLRGRNSGNSAWIFDSYNIAGDVATRNSGLAVTSNIPPMQAFWVRVSSGKTAATLSLNNSMRSHNDVANNKFRAPANLNPLVRLLVSNGTNSDETVIYFNANASNGYDAYDSPKMFNNNPNIPEIYTRAGSEKLVINGMTQYYGGLQIPLGFITGQSNTLSIRANELRNINPDIQIILKDKLLNTEFNLTQGAAYSFTSVAANTEERFEVMFAATSSTWTGAVSASWNTVENWSNGTPASVTSTVITDVINQPVISGTASTATITMHPNTRLTINSSGTLKVYGDYTLQSNEAGTATLVNDGLLTVTGNTTMQQYLSSDRNWYMSSPFSNATAPGGYNYYEYREPGDNTGFTAPATAYWKSISQDDIFAIAKGYIVKPNVAPATFSLSGSLNNGNLSPVVLTRTSGKDKEGFNLVGNPYPSYLNISSIQNNEDMDKSFWYRTRNSGNTQWTFDTYNVPGSIGTANSGKAISDKIPPMQAFWVRVASGKTAATINFNNAMRVHQDYPNNKFRAPARPVPLVRLVVSNGINSDETVIYFNEDAADIYDIYDSPKMFNNSASVPEIYSLAGNEQLAINGMKNHYAGLQLPLGFNTGQSNTFSIRAGELSNINADLILVLKDNELNTEFDLTSGESYNFSSNAVKTENRFVLMFKSAGGNTAINDADMDAVYVSELEKRLKLHINTEIINAEVKVYNTSGKLIHSQNVVNHTTLINKIFDPGVYVVKVLNGGQNTVLRALVR